MTTVNRQVPYLPACLSDEEQADADRQTEGQTTVQTTDWKGGSKQLNSEPQPQHSMGMLMWRA